MVLIKLMGGMDSIHKKENNRNGIISTQLEMKPRPINLLNLYSIKEKDELMTTLNDYICNLS